MEGAVMDEVLELIQQFKYKLIMINENEKLIYFLLPSMF
jgi:hypothetical protein